MGSVLHRTEYSENNHFMYYVPPPKHQNRRRASDAHLLAATKNTPKDWKAPTKMMRMTYANWLSHANVSDDKLGPHNPHWYYRLIGCGGTGNDGSCDKGSSEYLFDELTFFQPRESLYIVEPEEQKGYGKQKQTHWRRARTNNPVVSNRMRPLTLAVLSFCAQDSLPFRNEGGDCREPF
jgi:hypothetical protein